MRQEVRKAREWAQSLGGPAEGATQSTAQQRGDASTNSHGLELKPLALLGHPAQGAEPVPTAPDKALRLRSRAMRALEVKAVAHRQPSPVPEGGLKGPEGHEAGTSSLCHQHHQLPLCPDASSRLRLLRAPTSTLSFHPCPWASLPHSLPRSVEALILVCPVESPPGLGRAFTPARPLGLGEHYPQSGLPCPRPGSPLVHVSEV